MPRFRSETTGGDAKRQLRLRLLREEIGDEAYDRMIADADDRPFKIFGVIFVAVFAAVVFGAAWLAG